MLKLKGVVGAENGFLSEEALVIILVTWLQKNFYLTKAQFGLPSDMKRKTYKEKVP